MRRLSRKAYARFDLSLDEVIIDIELGPARNDDVGQRATAESPPTSGCFRWLVEPRG